MRAGLGTRQAYARVEGGGPRLPARADTAKGGRGTVGGIVHGQPPGHVAKREPGRPAIRDAMAQGWARRPARPRPASEEQEQGPHRPRLRRRKRPSRLHTGPVADPAGNEKLAKGVEGGRRRRARDDAAAAAILAVAEGVRRGDRPRRGWRYLGIAG